MTASRETILSPALRLGMVQSYCGARCATSQGTCVKNRRVDKACPRPRLGDGLGKGLNAANPSKSFSLSVTQPRQWVPKAATAGWAQLNMTLPSWRALRWPELAADKLQFKRIMLPYKPSWSVRLPSKTLRQSGHPCTAAQCHKQPST
jgi:hypothetical protein